MVWVVISTVRGPWPVRKPSQLTSPTRAKERAAMMKVRVNPDSAGSVGAPGGKFLMVVDARSVVTMALPIALPVEREIELMPLAMPL